MSADEKVLMPEILVLLINGRVIGKVSRSIAKAGTKLTFDYEPGWREARGAMPLSLSMPLSGASYGDDMITPWMWNLLPDNDRTLQKIAVTNHVSPQNVFALLWVIGEDCPGAVQFVESDRVSELAAGGDIKWLTDAEIAERLADLKRTQSMGRQKNEGQFSLPGAQPKTALLRGDDGRWGVPSGRIPTTHILKPPISDLDGQAENEVFCLALANKAGLAAARANVMRFGEEIAIVVERYDRFRNREGEVRRIHQEDMCQAMAVHPAKKYENEGGPGIVKIMDLLNWSSDPTEDRRRFMRAIAFNFVIMGTDAHAKNYSMLFAAGRVRLAPLYDVASYIPYVPERWQDLRMPMKIGDHYLYSDIYPRHWERMAKVCGFPADEAIQQVAELVHVLPGAAAEVAVELRAQGIEHSVLDELVEGINWRCAYLEKTWGLTPEQTEAPAEAASTKFEM